MRQMHRMPFDCEVVAERSVRLYAPAVALPLWTLEPRRV